MKKAYRKRIEMNKSYRCDFCEYDRGPIQETHENCSDCKYGSNFKLRKRMSERQKHEWNQHIKFDDFIDETGTKLSDIQYEFAHRVLEYKNAMYIRPLRARDVDNMALISAFKFMLENEPGKIQVLKEYTDE